MNSFKTPFVYVFEPISFTASDLKNSISNLGTVLFSASSYIEEYEDLKKEVIELSSNRDQILNYEEFNSLKESTNVFIPEDRYVLSKALGITEKGDLYINTGNKDGIKEGNIVSVGNVFVGVVSSTEHSSSLVTLPTSRTSVYEVVILPSDIEKINSLDGYIKSRAVIAGGPDGIKIENIGSNADISDGDIVVIRDERVDQLLVVGRVVSLSKNPAATSKSGFVSPIFDYANLLTVFVKIE
jgi:cell shape-determining protein MreC